MKYFFVALSCLLMSQVVYAQGFEPRLEGPGNANPSLDLRSGGINNRAAGSSNSNLASGMGFEFGESIGIYLKLNAFLTDHISFAIKLAMDENWGTFFVRMIGCDSESDTSCQETTNISFFNVGMTGTLRFYTGKKEGLFIGGGRGILWNLYKYRPTETEQFSTVRYSLVEVGFKAGELDLFIQAGQRDNAPELDTTRIDSWDTEEAQDMWRKSLVVNRIAIGASGKF